ALLLADVTQRDRGLRLRGGETVGTGLEMLGPPVETRLASVQVGGSPARLFLAWPQLGEPALRLGLELLDTHVLGLQVGLDAGELGLPRRERGDSRFTDI